MRRMALRVRPVEAGRAPVTPEPRSRSIDVSVLGGVPQELLFDLMKAIITRDLRLEAARSFAPTGPPRRGPPPVIEARNVRSP
jgi:hypothetical protein